jgi:hypothetical protein
MEDIELYVKSTYNFKLDGFDKIEYITLNNIKLVTLYFTNDTDGQQYSVLYSESKGDQIGMGTKKFRIDCTGSCGCKEQFNFNTNTAQCSCTDCTMTITELEIAAP